MNYTPAAKKAIDHAKRVSKRLKHNYIGTEHLLLGLLHTEDSLAAKVFLHEGINEENVIKLIEELIAPDGSVSVMERGGFTPKAERVLSDAEEEAVLSRLDEIGTEHIALALLKTPDCAATRLLASLEVSLQKIYQEIVASMGESGAAYQEEVMKRSRMRGRPDRASVLEQYSRNISALAHEGKLDPIIGRKDEIQRVIEILSRRGKNNPCLIGEPGVGKTAIVEGLAEYIETGMVPDTVAGKRIMALDLSGMVAGTKYRGEFEERIKNVINEAIEDKSIILFIDEVHTMIGAGGAEGAMDAANILKPAMARGDIQIIGATTVTEYHKYIEKDAALERRFQQVMVEEPTVSETKEILSGIRGQYEKHHGITISDEALSSCAELSARYISDRFLPDKAIDLMDEASARLVLSSAKTPEKIYEYEKNAEDLLVSFEKALMEERFDEASEIRIRRNRLLEDVKKLKGSFERSKKRKKMILTEEDIAEVVSRWTKIPVTRLNESESHRLSSLEKTLHKRIIGQEEAVSAVARAVRRGRVGLKEPKRPIGSFLFLGPTGVGKTEVSKALAEAVFGDENKMIRVDMTEYMEKQSVAKMIGSPPGYVGYDEGGQLAEKVRRNPYSVILFDEIEKAHPDVFNVLLQVLDDGHITDSQGRKVDFKNTIIIMTSNAGAKEIMEPKHLGFSAEDTEKSDYEYMKGRVMEEIKHEFKPEFLNRIDETIVFRALNKNDLVKISGLLLTGLSKRLMEEMSIDIHIKPSVQRYIVEKAYDPKFGARPLRRKIQTDLEDQLSDAILKGEIKGNSNITCNVADDKIVFETPKTKNGRKTRGGKKK
ncbi:MAG: ATP-dependent Clp protease ATP-binding subunit [Lachnospiraceae bacterium]|nr:ATP-dependent Clp protease ATP-binding subunit [Lachnospiraceae bacterium]